MSEQPPSKPGKPKLIPAHFDDADSAMSKRILLGFAVIVGGLLILLAVGHLRNAAG